jgi:glycerophosphoryl diester phosphodiesterase
MPSVTKSFFKTPYFFNAHRGLSSVFPENTKESFQAAIDAGADVIESDVRLTKDGEVVLFHDESAQRVTGTNLIIAEARCSQIQNLDAGNMFSPDNGKTFPFRGRGFKILTLNDALSAFPKTKFNIDLKDKNPLLAEKFCRIINDADAEDRVLAGSFHPDMVRMVRKILPGMATAFTSGEVLRFILLSRTGLLFAKKSFCGDALQLPEYGAGMRIVTPSLIREVHSKGLKIYVWTINDPKHAQKLKNDGIDGIFSDDIAILKNEIR